MEKYLLAGKSLFDVWLEEKKRLVAQYIHMSSVEEYILFLVTFSALFFTVLLVYTSVIYFRCHFRNCVSSASVKYTFH